jgi:hypothetical protein
MGAYEMAVLVAVGIHSELPLVSDSSESGRFHPTDHWKGEEASECFAGLQTQNMKRYFKMELHAHGETFYIFLALCYSDMALSNIFLRPTLCGLTGKWPAKDIIQGDQKVSVHLMAITECIRNADRAILNTDRATLNTDSATLNTVFENTVRRVNKCLETGRGTL